MNKDEKILKRIKSLLNMASDSSSPNEAMIAARRARTLMDKHQINKDDLLSIDENSFGTANGERAYRNTPAWVSMIAGSVSHLNDCQSIISRTWKGVTFEFRGFKSDAFIAKYTHDYLVDTCNRLLERSDISGRSERNFYRLGFTQEIGRRIQEIVSDRHSGVMTSGGKDLIVQKREMVNAHFDELKAARRPNVRHPSMSESSAAAKGSKDAENVSLDKRVGRDENLQLSI